MEDEPDDQRQRFKDYRARLTLAMPHYDPALWRQLNPGEELPAFDSIDYSPANVHRWRQQAVAEVFGLPSTATPDASVTPAEISQPSPVDQQTPPTALTPERTTPQLDQGLFVPELDLALNQDVAGEPQTLPSKTVVYREDDMMRDSPEPTMTPPRVESPEQDMMKDTPEPATTLPRVESPEQDMMKDTPELAMTPPRAESPEPPESEQSAVLLSTPKSCKIKSPIKPATTPKANKISPKKGTIQTPKRPVEKTLTPRNPSNDASPQTKNKNNGSEDRRHHILAQRPRPPSTAKAYRSSKDLKKLAKEQSQKSAKKEVRHLPDIALDKLGFYLDGDLAYPKWFNDMAIPASERRTVKNDCRDEMKKIKRLSDSLQELRDGKTTSGAVAQALDELRPIGVSRKLIVVSKAFDKSNGLPAIFEQQSSLRTTFKDYVQADAKELYNLWCLGLYDCNEFAGWDIFYGIKFTTTGRLKYQFEDKLVRHRADFHGQGHLVNGQWWPSVLCAMRDGAHGASQSGIYGKAGEGTFSVIVAGHEQYLDNDEGDFLEYHATGFDTANSDSGTSRLKESLHNQRPVRVIRSYALSVENRWRPTNGLRYDGLYTVTKMEVIDGRSMFSLRRNPGQPPIRFEGEGKRPTRWEIESVQKTKEDHKGLDWTK